MRRPKDGTQKGRGGQWIAALCLVGLATSTHAGTHQIEGRIVGVTDGDTITLLDVDNRQHKIRLDGIDAPESGQPFGRASKKHLAELLADREAVVECSKTDRYRREVCRVLVGAIPRSWATLLGQPLVGGTPRRDNRGAIARAVAACGAHRPIDGTFGTAPPRSGKKQRSGVSACQATKPCFK